MMNKRLFIPALFLIVQGINAGPVYDQLYSKFTQYDHRKPGGENFAQCADALEKQLEQKGLQVHRQTYNTLVPVTKTCVFKINGAEVGPVYPLGPNGATLSTTGGRQLEGPLTWLENGTFDTMDNLPVDGSIALLNLGTPNMQQVFSQGAKAVIFVGNDEATQWKTIEHFSEHPFVVPRFYMARKTAETAGLLTNAGHRASIESITVWEDRVASTLWLELPGEKNAQFNLGTEEAILLTAELSTSGAVPDFTPENRQAANAALLAELATKLAHKKHKRSIFIAFLGSHYAAEEGIRYLYYAINKAEKGGWNTDPLDARAENYRQELKLVQRRIAALQKPDFLATADQRLKKLIRQKLDAIVNNFNFEIREIVIKQIQRPNAELKKEENRLKAEKLIWNTLRRDIKGDKIPSARYAQYEEVLNNALSDQQKREAELKGMLTHNLSAQKLSKRFEGKSLTLQLSLDFAQSDAPWLLSPLVNYRTVRDDNLFIGNYLNSLQGLGKIAKATDTPLLEDALSGIYSPYSLCAKYERSGSAMGAIAYGIPGYQMMSAGNPLNHDELPIRKDVQLQALLPLLSRFIESAANSPEISLRPILKKQRFHKDFTPRHLSGDKYFGHRYFDLAKGSGDIAGPAQNAIALGMGYKEQHTKPNVGRSRMALSRINAAGLVFFPMTTKIGDRRLSLGFDDNGLICRVPGSNIYRLFYGYGGGFFVPFKPRLQGFVGKSSSAFLNARSDSKEKNFHDLSGKYHKAYIMGKEANFKYIGAAGTMLLGNTKREPQGFGYKTDPFELISLNAVRLSAHDYCLLNQSRLQVLREKNIVSDSLEKLQAEAKQHLEFSETARKEKKNWKAIAHEVFAMSLGVRAYLPLKGITNDLVQAVIVLLILAIPFAFCMERLIFGFTSIYKQVGGFVGIFIGTFVVLYFVHPAFSLAAAPIVIFLAFVILLMSSLVILLIMSKFRQELRALQGLASTAHGTSEDSSTAVASVLIGISGMRNRPIKTLLTATTVVLLTFTILVFASFTSTLDVVPTYLGKGLGQDRIEIHRFSYLPLPNMLTESIRALYKEDFDLFYRSASFFNPSTDDSEREPDRMVYNPAAQRAAKMGGLVGFDPKEILHGFLDETTLPGFTQTFSNHPPLYVSDAVAKRLQLTKAGTELRIYGEPFIFAGVFDAKKIAGAINLDNSAILAPNFKTLLAEELIKGGTDGSEDSLEKMDTSSFYWYGADEIAITTTEALLNLGGTVNFMSMYPKENTDIEKSAAEIAGVFDGPIYAKGPQGSKKYFFTKAMEGSGFSETIVPLLLGGLIIFSSLLGSIVDREREIFTYSALGLAPPNVGALFFAESGVYAVIGGLGGYLFSQLIAKFLSVLASFGLFTPPEMNFSSLASVSTILVVMATVMLSTIYPALKAGKSANPGVARKWKMPAPKNNKINFQFPFTVSTSDLTGILHFIKEHFDNHCDASIGEFAARDVGIFNTQEKEGYGIQALISLAPFDLGVFQQFKMYSKESEIEGIDEVIVELEKVAGAPNAWIRGNRTFIDDLRNQFLLWRSLPAETTDQYRSMKV